MELFKDPHFDFLGRKWWFILPSLVLISTGLVSLPVNGPRYGIDFQGGAVMGVNWDGPPPVERIRAAVSSRLNGASVVAAHDRNGSNEVLVSVETPSQQDLAAVRQTIADAVAGGHREAAGFHGARQPLQKGLVVLHDQERAVGLVGQFGGGVQGAFVLYV